jgi:hypothetical protein
MDSKPLSEWVGIRKIERFEPESTKNQASGQGKAIILAVNQPTVASIMSMEYGILENLAYANVHQ